VEKKINEKATTSDVKQFNPMFVLEKNTLARRVYDAN